MELFNLIDGLCMFITFLLAASDHANAQRYGNSTIHGARFTLQPLLQPRMQEVEQDRVVTSFDTQMNSRPNRKLLLQAPSGKRQEEKVMVTHEQQIGKAAIGTWREWIESPNRSDFFTMDYHWVRRRRPIHNKHLLSLLP